MRDKTIYRSVNEGSREREDFRSQKAFRSDEKPLKSMPLKSYRFLSTKECLEIDADSEPEITENISVTLSTKPVESKVVLVSKDESLTSESQKTAQSEHPGEAHSKFGFFEPLDVNIEQTDAYDLNFPKL